MGKILILAQSQFTGNTGNTGNTDNPDDNNNTGTGGGNINTDPITPNTPQHPWAYFNGVDSCAELVTPLVLSQDGDYVEFDMDIASVDQQPIPDGLNSEAQEFYREAYSQGVIGNRENPYSFMLWMSEIRGYTNIRLTRSDRNDNFKTPGNQDFTIPARKFKHKLAIEGNKFVYYKDGTLMGSVTRNTSNPNFYITYLGNAATAVTQTGQLFYTRMYMRNLKIKAAGVETDFGNLVNTTLLTRTNVTSATNPVF